MSSSKAINPLRPKDYWVFENEIKKNPLKLTGKQEGERRNG